MAKKGGKVKLKRLAAPITYKVPRKRFKWVVRPVSGPHPSDMSIPLAILLRDVLGVAKNLREVKYILRKGYVKVDGRVIKEYRFPIGIMDVIELVPAGKFLRILPTVNNPLEAIEISSDDEKVIKPLLIKNKVMVKGGNIQLTTHDGRNFVFNKESEFSGLKPGDTIVYDFMDSVIKQYFRFEKDVLALVYWGSKQGVVGKIVGVRKVHPLKPRLVTLISDGEVVETIYKYVFPIGVDKPIIMLGGVLNG